MREFAVLLLCILPSLFCSAFDIGQGFYASWRGFTLGASVKPAWFVPKLRNKDQKYNISVYGNRERIEFINANMDLHFLVGIRL